MIRKYIEKLTDIKIDGDNPYDIKVLDNRFFKTLLLKGSLGLGEAYVRKYWDVEDLYAFHVKLLTNPSIRKLSGSIWPGDVFNFFKEKLSLPSIKKARSNIQFHYDIGNDFYGAMLGKTMQYASAYFTEDKMDINEAQLKKFEIVADKLQVFQGCSVLEIGCGWGTFAKYLAMEKGCNVTAITLSGEQYKYCKENCSTSSNGRTQFFLSDFRETKNYIPSAQNKFDRVVGIGTIAHFVPMFKNLVNVITSHLKDGGLALIDDVCRDTTCRRFVPSQSAWTNKYIFPGTQFFSPDQITRYFKKKLIIEQWSSDRSYYRDTCLAWLANIKTKWEEICKMGNFDQQFYRTWEYYLSGAAAGFESGFLGQWQILLSKMSSPYRKNSRIKSISHDALG